MKISSKTLVLPQHNIDTDQIIPARFLTTTIREGLGAHAFADWRAADPDHILEKVEASDCQVLVAGHNFGCGSSREHAPWALLDFGFRVVISSSIADIFRQNAMKNGLVPVVIDEEAHSWLLEHPGADVVIDVAAMHLMMPGEWRVPFALDEFSRRCLLEGIDEMAYLLSKASEIGDFEQARNR